MLVKGQKIKAGPEGISETQATNLGDTERYLASTDLNGEKSRPYPGALIGILISQTSIEYGYYTTGNRGLPIVIKNGGTLTTEPRKKGKARLWLFVYRFNGVDDPREHQVVDGYYDVQIKVTK